MGRIINALKEYGNRKDKKNGLFFVGDFTELLNISKDNYELMANSLNAGFIIGYKAAKREMKNTGNK